MHPTRLWFSLVILFGISAYMVCCNSTSKEIPAVVLFTQSLVSEPGGVATIEVPKGSVIKYLGEASSDSGMWKVQFKSNIGWLPRWSFALKSRAGVIITDGKASPEVDGPFHDLSAGLVVAVDTTNGALAHITYIAYAGSLSRGWFSKDLVSMDTMDIAFADALEAISKLPSAEQPRAYATLLRDHPDSRLVSVISMNLQEASNETIDDISDKYGFIIDKGAGKIMMLRKTADAWLTEYLTDILNYPFEDRAALPKTNYYERYVYQLPTFVRRGPRFEMPGDMGEEQSWKAYLLFRMDRRPENIKKLYSTFRSIIIPQVNYQSIVNYMDQLITVHDHIFSLPNYKQRCANISKQVTALDAQTETTMAAVVDQRGLYEPIFHAPTMSNFPADDYNTLGIWYHSFWVRRIREGNADVVYEIIRDLATTVHTMNPDSENMGAEVSSGDGGAEPTVMTCVFQDYSSGDCAHIEFDCGDYGEADTSQLSGEAQELWHSLAIEDNGEIKGNPIYVGRKFQITVGTTTGTICNEGQGGQGDVPLILSFVLLDK